MFRQAFNELKSRNHIIITNADKGGIDVIFASRVIVINGNT